MITRFRFESIADNDEDVDTSLDLAVARMLDWLHTDQPDDAWECTDRTLIPILKNGHGMVYGRRVFRSKAKEVAHDTTDNKERA